MTKVNGFSRFIKYFDEPRRIPLHHLRRDHE